MRKQTVLVVDDEDLFRQTVVDALNEMAPDVNAVGVSDGLLALEYIARHTVDVLVTDLQMPNVDGVTLLREVLNRKLRIPVIVMTAHGTPEVERWTTSRLAFAIFEKPLDLVGLLATIERLLTPTETGHIEGITLAGLCQLLHLERKTCELRVRSGLQNGRLIFRDGTLEDAVHDDAVGDIAAAEIFAWSQPSVEMSGRVPPQSPARVKDSVTFLLMESARIVDERKMRGDDPPPPPRRPRPLTPVVLPSLVSPRRTEIPERSRSSTSLSSVVPPAPPSTGSAISTSAISASAAEDALAPLATLNGFIAAALVDVATGAVIGMKSSGAFDLAAAASATAEVVRARRKANARMKLQDQVEDALVTLRTQHHVIRPLQHRPSAFFVLVLERSATVALARRSLEAAERALAHPTGPTDPTAQTATG